MRRYSKVQRYLWRDPEFRRLSDEEKLVWLHLLTSPLTVVTGLIVDTPPFRVARYLGWDGKTGTERVENALETLVGLGWVRQDEEAELIILPKAVAHNPPENSSVVRGWLRRLEEVPDSVLKDEWISLARESVGGLPRADAFSNYGGEVTPPAKGKAKKKRREKKIPDPPAEDPSSLSGREREMYEALKRTEFYVPGEGPLSGIAAVKDPVSLAKKLGGAAYPSVSPNLIDRLGVWTMENRQRGKKKVERFLINRFSHSQERGGNGRGGSKGVGDIYPHGGDLRQKVGR